MHPEAEVWKKKAGFMYYENKEVGKLCVVSVPVEGAAASLQTDMQKGFKYKREEWVCVCVSFLMPLHVHEKHFFFIHAECLCWNCWSARFVCFPLENREIWDGAEGFFFSLSEGVDDGISGWKEDEVRRLLLLKFRSRVPPPSDVIKSSGGDEF